jgi:hypothetical protein
MQEMLKERLYKAWKTNVKNLQLFDLHIKELVKACDQQTPEGTEKTFFILSYEPAWRGPEGATAEITFFKEETNNIGDKTGRIQYNPLFMKTTQGGSRKLADTKWLVKNNSVTTFSAIRLFLRFQHKRGKSTLENHRKLVQEQSRKVN